MLVHFIFTYIHTCKPSHLKARVPTWALNQNKRKQVHTYTRWPKNGTRATKQRVGWNSPVLRYTTTNKTLVRYKTHIQGPQEQRTVDTTYRPPRQKKTPTASSRHPPTPDLIHKLEHNLRQAHTKKDNSSPKEHAMRAAGTTNTKSNVARAVGTEKYNFSECIN